jgi:hypothetical protein
LDERYSFKILILNNVKIFKEEKYMKFGVRECANIVFKAKSDVRIGNKNFKKGQPVLYIDTAKTSTVEGAATTVYAQGGRGNTRLIGWEGEKTLTFTVEDALLSPLGFSILSGAGLFGTNSKSTDKLIHFHTTTYTTVSEANDEFTIDLSDALAKNEKVCEDEGFTFVALTEDDGSISSVIDTDKVTVKDNVITLTDAGVKSGDSVFVDYYILKTQANVDEMQIDAEHFAGYYYVEADTLFRRQSDGVDLPANLTFPNVKIQSNFTFTMASTGDPSTFTFTMDAFPGYTLFDKTKKVLCVLQVVNDVDESEDKGYTVMDTHEHTATQTATDTSAQASLDEVVD